MQCMKLSNHVLNIKNQSLIIEKQIAFWCSSEYLSFHYFIKNIYLVTMTFKPLKETHRKKTLYTNTQHTHTPTHYTKASFAKQYFLLPYGMHSGIFSSVLFHFLENSGWDPLNWFHDPLVGHIMHFEKHPWKHKSYTNINICVCIFIYNVILGAPIGQHGLS